MQRGHCIRHLASAVAVLRQWRVVKIAKVPLFVPPLPLFPLKIGAPLLESGALDIIVLLTRCGQVNK